MIANDLFTFSHFDVREAFKNCSDSEIAECVRSGYLPNVLTLLHHLDNIRSLFCKPIIVSSCYRGFQHNKNCGGVSTSQHLQGCAIDFHPQLVKGRYDLQELKRLAKVVVDYQKDAQCFGQFIVYDIFLHCGLLDSSRSTCSYFHVINNNDTLFNFLKPFVYEQKK